MTSTAHAVVAAVDGSASSLTALQHAAAEAQLRHLPLTVLHAWEIYPLEEGGFLSLEEVRSAEEQVLATALEQLHASHPDLEHTSTLVRTRPDTALVDASRGAALLVLGTHAGSRAWLGSVLGHVTARAHCPVVVVPAATPVRHGDVVVGVDGSSVSLEAIGFAFDQAARWGSTLIAVLALPPSFDAYQPSEQVLDQLHERGRRQLAESLAGWSEKYPDVPVQQVVSLDGPLPALQQAAKDAAMIVVGSHGRGAVLRVTLGSVSSSLLRHSPCPVTVVRPHDHSTR